MSLGSKLHIHKMYLSKETDEDRMSSCSAQTYSQKRKLDAGRRDKGNLFLWQETGILGLYFQNWTQSQPSLIPYFKSENGLSWMAKIWSRIYRLRQKEVYFCRVIFSRFSHLTLVVAWAAVFVLAEYSRRVNAVCRYAVHSSGHLTKFYLLIASYHKITLDRSAGGGEGRLLLKVTISISSSWWHTAEEQVPPTYLSQHASGLPPAYPTLLCTWKCSVSTHRWKPFHGSVSHPVHGLQVSMNNENSI